MHFLLYGIKYILTYLGHLNFINSLRLQEQSKLNRSKLVSVLNSEPSFLCEVSSFNKELHCYVLTTSVQEAIVGGTRQRFSLIGPLQSRDHCKALVYCQSISSCLSQHNLYCENAILLYNSRQVITL